MFTLNMIYMVKALLKNVFRHNMSECAYNCIILRDERLAT